jgi:hypothetical protein
VFNKSFKLLISNTIHEVYLFLPLIIQVGNDQRDMLEDYCNTLEQFVYNLLWKNNGKRQILLYADISTLQSQHELSRQNS